MENFLTVNMAAFGFRDVKSHRFKIYASPNFIPANSISLFDEIGQFIGISKLGGSALKL